MNRNIIPSKVSAITDVVCLRGRQRERGFTLIELLAVIAVIATLMSLLLVGIGKVRHSAMKTGNAANLRSLARAWHSYAGDNGDCFPIGLTWATDNVLNAPSLSTLNYRYWWRWYGGVADYLPMLVVGDTEAARNYAGPMAPTWGQVYEGYYPPMFIDEARERGLAHVGYHFNRHVGFERRTSRSTFVDLARTPILYAYWNEEAANPFGQYFSSPLMDGSSFLAYATAPMGDGNHFAYADGHVEWVDAHEDLAYYLDHMTWRPEGD